VRMVAGLTTGLKVSSKSMPGRWVKPRRTHRALYRSREPSERNLCLNIHFPDNVGMSGSRHKIPCMVLQQSGEFFLHSGPPIRIGKGTTKGLRSGATWYIAGCRNPCLARVVMACLFTTGGTGTAPFGRGAGPGGEAQMGSARTGARRV